MLDLIEPVLPYAVDLVLLVVFVGYVFVVAYSVFSIYPLLLHGYDVEPR